MNIVTLSSRREDAQNIGGIKTDSGSALHCVDKNEVIRHFALSFAEMLRNDKALNQSAPLIIDKIVVMLMSESRRKV